jgi:predicted esterase
MSRLRLLCLHGFGGSGPALRAQMQGAFGDLEAAAEVELVCPDAPRLADGRSAWWNALPVADPASPGKLYEGWAHTRDSLIALFAESGPFDGVFGFSQGAALGGLLVGLRAADGVPSHEQPLQFGFAILVGGFVSNDAAHLALYAAQQSYALASLHLIGRADRIVPPEASRALAARFAAPLVVEHDGGHVIASRAEVKQALSAFLNEQQALPRA